MRRYINHTCFKKHNGKNYPIGSDFLCDEEGRVFNGDGFMCLVSSQKSRDCLVGNDDGKGEERGKLVKSIYKLLYNPLCEDHKEDQLELLWSDEVSLPYAIHKTPEEGAWLWNDSYFCAPLEDLKHIEEMLKGVRDEYIGKTFNEHDKEGTH